MFSHPKDLSSSQSLSEHFHSTKTRGNHMPSFSSSPPSPLLPLPLLFSLQHDTELEIIIHWSVGMREREALKEKTVHTQNGSAGLPGEILTPCFFSYKSWKQRVSTLKKVSGKWELWDRHILESLVFLPPKMQKWSPKVWRHQAKTDGVISGKWLTVHQAGLGGHWVEKISTSLPGVHIAIPAARR